MREFSRFRKQYSATYRKYPGPLPTHDLLQHSKLCAVLHLWLLGIQPTLSIQNFSCSPCSRFTREARLCVCTGKELVTISHVYP